MSMRAKAAPPCAKTKSPAVSRCLPMAAASSGPPTAPSAIRTRTTAWRCSVVLARRTSSVSWSTSVCPVYAATPAAYPASTARNTTVAVSGTRPIARSATPVTAVARASSRRRDRVGSTFSAVRMPVPVAPVRARINRAKVTGPPPRSAACSTATAAAAAIAPATAAQAPTISGTEPVRPLSGPSAVDGPAQALQRRARAGRRRTGQFEEVQGGDRGGEQAGRDVRAEGRLVEGEPLQSRTQQISDERGDQQDGGRGGDGGEVRTQGEPAQGVEMVRQRAYRGALRGRGGQQRGRRALLGDGPQPFADAGDEDGDEDHHERLVGHPVDPQRGDDEQCEP